MTTALSTDIASRKRILVVDDEPLLVRIIEHLLTKAGCTVVTARNGREALARVQEQRFDLVLSDVMLPMVDGAALAQALPTLPDPPPVVFLTGYGDSTAPELRAMGACEVLGKPITPQILRDVVAQYAR